MKLGLSFKHAFPQNILGLLTHLYYCVEVTNLNSLPVTITEVGLEIHYSD